MRLIFVVLICGGLVLSLLGLHYVDISHNMINLKLLDMSLFGFERNYREVYLDGIRGVYLGFAMMFIGCIYALSYSRAIT